MDAISDILVYHAGSIGEADVIVAWLAEQGIEAYVKDRLAGGTLQVPQIVAPLGIEVCVVDPAQAESARALLSQHRELTLKRHASPDGGTLSAVCEECGNSSDFPISQRGTVQSCPHCRAYVDVPEARAE